MSSSWTPLRSNWHNLPIKDTPITAEDVMNWLLGIGLAHDRIDSVNLSLANLAPVLTPVASYTYNTDGTVATATENGVATTYAYNTDGTVHTATRAGVTRTYSYNPDGSVAGVA